MAVTEIKTEIKSIIDKAFRTGDLELLTEIMPAEHLELIDSYYCAKLYISHKTGDKRKHLIACYHQLIKELTFFTLEPSYALFTKKMFFLRLKMNHIKEARERGEVRDMENRVSTGTEFINEKLKELKKEIEAERKPTFKNQRLN